MKFKEALSLKKIASLLEVEYVGDPNFEVLGINEIHVVEKGYIVFVDHPKYYEKALNSLATTILINKKVACPVGKSLLISEDPFRDFNKITTYFNPFISSEEPISKSSMIGKDTIVQPNVFIGNNVKIGQNCVIHPNVTIYDNSIIGDHVTIHANTVIGADAFYYKKRPEGFDQLISCGRVVIEDNVGLGALCTIDKGVTGDTTIGAGSKLDNQVHVGHDTIIGKKCLIAAQTGIAGSTKIGKNCMIGGQVGIVGHLKIADEVKIAAQSGIGQSIEKPGTIVQGSPALSFLYAHMAIF